MEVAHIFKNQLCNHMVNQCKNIVFKQYLDQFYIASLCYKHEKH